MDVKEFAIANLGKTVIWNYSSYYPYSNGMIVGYSKLQEAVIVSFTNEDGWSKEADEEEDIILLHSPLNVSLWYIYPDSIYKRWWIER